MKTNMQRMRWFLSLMLIVLFAGTSVETKAQQSSVSFQVFYNELQPYGTWLIHPRFGDVWRPNVDGDFTPYLTNGYWTVTQYGNTWMSDYDWGWATFHYGRWYNDNFDGWIWIPDGTWAPAWVAWRNGGGYYGWAPLSPGIGFSLSVNFYNSIPNSYWSFVPYRYVWDRYAYRYCAPRHQNMTIVNNTTYVTNYYSENNHHYYNGPSHDEIRRVTHQPVRVHHVENDERPGRGRIDHDRVSMYMPSITRNENERPEHSNNPRTNTGNHFGLDRDKDRDQNDGQHENGNDSPRTGNGSSHPGNGTDHNKGGDNRNNGSHNNNDRSSNWNDSRNNGGQNNPTRTENGNGNENKSRGDNNSNQSTNWNENKSRNNSQNTPTRLPNLNDNRTRSQQTIPRQSGGAPGNTHVNRSGGSNGNSSNQNIPNRSIGSRGNSNVTVPSRSGGSNRNSNIVIPHQSGGSKSTGPRRKN